MKSINFIYSTEKQFRELIAANELKPEKAYLVRIHTCVHNPDTIMPFVRIILSALPNARIIGSSTCGVIYEGEIMEDCCLVSITGFQNASVSTFMLPLSSGGSDLTGEALADSVKEQLGEKAQRFMLTFFSRPFIKITDYVDALNSSMPDMHIIGGVANTADGSPENSWLYQSFVFNENGVSNDAVVCAGISSEVMSVFGDIVYVTEPVGKVHTITDADGMIIRTVDGINAVDWYQSLLGVDLSKTDQSNYTSIFPLIKPDYHNIPWAVAYSPQNEESSFFSDEPEPVMFVPNEAKVGDKIRISYSSIQKTVDICESVCENICGHPTEVLFGYSCVSRRDMFSNCASWELLPFKKTNLSGAFLSGEIGNIDNFNLYCNYSFAVAALSESNSHIKLDIKALAQHSNSLIDDHIKIMEYLLQNNSEEQDSSITEQQDEIKSSLFIDDDTGLENVTKFTFDCNLGKFDKICMITIKNESLLKAFMSESKFLIYFNRFHKTIMDFMQIGGFNCYIYKKTALILTASPEVSDDDFILGLKELQNNISNFKFSSYVPVTDFAIVMHEDDMIKKAELALVRMRNKNQSFLVYTAELGLEKFNAQKMKMITILNDAISNDRVVPYFQGIRDNHCKDIKMYEALMRIEDEEGNVYTPYSFMSIAKEYGYYSDISYIMINKVLKIFRNSTDKVTINLNISDIYDYKITHSIFDFLKNAPHPENYIFELTETEEIEDYQVIHEFAEKIHKSGGSIAIDDFGSGFSNILNVLKINSDYIKIDGEIIKNISSDVYALEFLEMISNWANKHCKEIIAEFVENASIQDIVEQNNIRFSQGYFYSKPERLFNE